ncbi:MAG TPA: 16S rRNA pseudouridine(516) synthase [Ruminococcus sp.]|nr:16S rRNA pseudouridine(516) synthase [Ruminococcus sp.]
MDRIDKILVSQGIGSRREVQKRIKSGEVTVNGEIIRKPEFKANAENDKIAVLGKVLNYSEHIYIMMNKPAGVVSASNDNHDKTVIDILPDEYKRKGLFPAGRLDKDTEGLLIITDDGDFAHRMLSPKKHVDKQYIAQLDGEITEKIIQKFKQGIIFADGTKCLPAKLEIYNNDKKTGLVTICEGKFHQVKKMFISCGLNVVHLQRISIGDLYLDGNLPIGGCKLLTNLDKKLIFVGNLY